MDSPHYSDAEAYFQTHQQKQMGSEQWELRLYEKLVVLCKSAHYVVMQAPKAHLKVKHCLHETLKITEEIQKVTLLNQSELQMFNQQLQHLFLSKNYSLATLAELLRQAQRMELSYRKAHQLPRRGTHPSPPLNIKRRDV